MSDAVFALTCNAVITTSTPAEYIDAHHTFDIRNFDHFQAASMAIMCRRDGDCLNARRNIVLENRLENPDDPNGENFHRYHGDMTLSESARYAVAMVSWYANSVDVEALQAQLNKEGVAAEPAKAFIQDYKDARAAIDKYIAEHMTDIEKNVFLEVPNQVRAERQAYNQTHAALYADLDAATARFFTERDAGKVTDETISNIESVRASYLKTCASIDCTHDPLWNEASSALFYAYLARGEATPARVEAAYITPLKQHGSILSHSIPLLSFDIYKSQVEAMERHTQAHFAYEKALSQGMDEASAKSVLQGVEPYKFTKTIAWPIHRNNVDKYIPNPFQFIPKVDTVEVIGMVKSLKKEGDKTKVIFSDIVKEYSKVDCVDTTKVDRIKPDGTLVYRQKCKTLGKGTRRTTIDPVVVPSVEAAKLKAGETVEALVLEKEREGNITEVKKDDKVVQIRSHRVTFTD